MDLHILSRWDAEKFEPNKLTHAIRIFSSYDSPSDRKSLRKSALYKHIGQYEFDDNDTHPILVKCGDKWLDEETAKQIISEFKENKGEVEALLVHCSRGENRAPAVTIALNDLFDLDNDSVSLREKYPHTNHFVYEMLMRVGKSL
jgi:predicted protein tyrosine phosphatase